MAVKNFETYVVNRMEGMNKKFDQLADSFNQLAKGYESIEARLSQGGGSASGELTYDWQVYGQGKDEGLKEDLEKISRNVEIFTDWEGRPQRADVISWKNEVDVQGEHDLFSFWGDSGIGSAINAMISAYSDAQNKYTGLGKRATESIVSSRVRDYFAGDAKYLKNVLDQITDEKTNTENSYKTSVEVDNLDLVNGTEMDYCVGVETDSNKKDSRETDWM